MDPLFEHYLFEIPIYFCEEKEYYARLEKKFIKTWEWFLARTSPEKDQPKNIKEEMKDYNRKKNGGWRYDQIIGYLRVFVLGNQIQGEMWIINNKVIRSNIRRKRFINIGKAFEVTVNKNDSPLLILFGEIEKIKSERPIKDHYLDMECCNNLAASIDWKKIFPPIYFQ